MMQHLSQGVLNAWMTCPRQFQHLYLDCLLLPANPHQQERMVWGSRFHWLMQQSIQNRGAECKLTELGAESAAEMSLVLQAGEDAEAQALHQAVDRTWAGLRQWWDQSGASDWELDAEHRRTLAMGDHLLTVVYDLLATRPTEAQIFDWKTHAQPLSRDRLQEDWQTRLYLFVLAETSHLPPDRLTMSYWFVRSPAASTAANGPELAYETFAYSADWHQATRAQLLEMAQAIDQAIAAYHGGQALPQLPAHSPACRSCSFASRCGRSTSVAESAVAALPWTLTEPLDRLWDAIEEIPI
jgi:hypothetical protein